MQLLFGHKKIKTVRMPTQQQLEKIAAYCKAMGVKYYDVELELVDHFAGSIEHLQKEKPNLNFEDALQLANQQFAPGEFINITKSKEQQLRVRFKRLLWKEFLAYFTFPKLLLTLCLMLLLISVNYYCNTVDLSIYYVGYLPTIILTFNILLARNGNIMISTKKINIRPKFPLLVNQVLTIRNIFMLSAPFIAYLFLGIIADILKGVLRSKGYAGFYAIKVDILLYPFPLFIVFCLAWRKVFVDQTILMRKQYTLAFDN